VSRTPATLLAAVGVTAFAAVYLEVSLMKAAGVMMAGYAVMFWGAAVLYGGALACSRRL